MAFKARWMAAVGAACLAGTALGDVVIDWNNVLLDTIRATGGPPCPISRAGAMTHAAIYEAVNSVDGAFDPYIALLPTPAGTSREAAAAQAARDVLVSLFPARQAIYDAALAASLSGVPNGQGKDDGIALGHAAAAEIMAARANDGTQTEPPYVYGNRPGDYRPTYPDFTTPPFNPGWGGTRPWTMITGSQFRTHGPLNQSNLNGLIHSRGYAEAVNEIKSIGARDSATRTDEQTRQAFFWANDLNGTYKPPGQLFSITRMASADHNLTLSENARLFALVGLAMADAGLVAWDMKYRTDIDLWRPVTAIRLADTDDNPRTLADPNWEPLNPFSPPFPAYTSGHATFSAAHAAVMADFFGTDHITFTIDSEDPFYNALPVHGPRTYHSFAGAAWENAQSRLFLGVHFRFDAVDGNRTGTQVGHFVFAHTLLPRGAADFNGDGRRDARDVLDFQHAFAAGSSRADINRDGRLDARDQIAFTRCFLTDCRSLSE